MTTSSEEFRALVVEQRDGQQSASVRGATAGELGEGNVLIAVEYSSLNYKDGLAVTGKGKVIRKFPMAPGIDLAGAVVESSSPEWAPGDRVICTGWGLGETHWGGYAQRARAKAEWLVRLPEGLDLPRAMAIGTAGFTAMLCVMALEEHGLAPGASKPVLVTGAAGGVGSVAVALLAQAGFRVAASTGRAETHPYLKSLGASEIVPREELAKSSPKPLEAERWSAAVDSVGGDTLANVLKSTGYGGSVAACGLAGGASLNTTVLPFILRAVNLLGIDSAACPIERRRKAWERLARELPAEKLASMTETIALGDVEHWSREILEGRVRGRVVVDVNR